MAEYSTITLRTRTKERLVLLKGSRSWDEFMEDLADHYPTDEAIAEMERRLKELRMAKVKGVPWREMRARLESRPK